MVSNNKFKFVAFLSLSYGTAYLNHYRDSGCLFCRVTVIMEIMDLDGIDYKWNEVSLGQRAVEEIWKTVWETEGHRKP